MANPGVQKWWARPLMLLILLGMCADYYGGATLFRLPFGIHEWAQSDRLSIAISYYDHGMNFFLPRTFSLHPIDGVTGVEFPLQAWLSAALGQLFGRENISLCFRLLGIGMALLGLYSLFVALYRRTGRFIVSAFLPVFVFCSPVYVVYSAAYLPDPFGVSLCFVSFSYLLRFLDTRALKHIVPAIIISGLASLVKTSTFPCFAASGIVGLLYFWRQQMWRPAITVFSTGAFMLLIIAGWIWRIQWLNHHYDAHIFQAGTNPFQSWAEVVNYVDFSFKPTWIHEYFLSEQLPVLTALFVLAFTLCRGMKDGREALLVFAILFAGTISFILLYGGSLAVHDYYGLALFFPFIIWMLLRALEGLSTLAGQGSRRLLHTGLIASGLIFFFLADRQIYQRLNQVDRYGGQDFMFRWGNNGAHILDSIGVSKQESILAFAMNGAPNLALIYFDRRGIVLTEDEYPVADIVEILRRKGLAILIVRGTLWDRSPDRNRELLPSFDMLYQSPEFVVMRLHPPVASMH